MADAFESLDQLSSQELRHRAFKLAEHRRDVKFFWHLLEMVPAAESIEGDRDGLAADVEGTRGWLEDFLHPGHPIEDAMRPVYIDYLREHG